MDKVLIKLYVPLIEQEYDVWIPLNKKLGKVIDLLVKSVCELSSEYYKPQEKPILYDKITAKPYNLNQNAKQNKIENGTEIVMI